jgi:hypothetical protein
MAVTSSTTYVAPNVDITLEVGGSYASYLVESIFRERFAQQLITQGFRVMRVTVEAGYGVISKDYRAEVVIRSLAQQKLNDIVSRVATAAEKAGSYTPTVSVPAVGESPQASAPKGLPDDIVDALGAIVRGAGTAVEGAGSTVAALPRVTTLLLVGIVVVVALVAFGPNVPSVARAARP